MVELRSRCHGGPRRIARFCSEGAIWLASIRHGAVRSNANRTFSPARADAGLSVDDEKKLDSRSRSSLAAGRVMRARQANSAKKTTASGNVGIAEAQEG
eukprot:2838008-Prymnesium_polylepis.1